MQNMTQAPNVPAGFTKRAGGDLMDASRQWASRSPDEAVYTVEQLVKRTADARYDSQEIDSVPWGDLIVVADDSELALAGMSNMARFTNYSFEQLCGLPVGESDSGSLAPSRFLAQLSPDTAAQVINERLFTHRIARKSDAAMLLGAGGESLRSITTEKYTRVWDHELAMRIAGLCDRGTWGPAQAFRRAGGLPNARHANGEQPALPLGWVGDRNMFVLLVDYEGAIEINGTLYARFLMISNSEVGDGSLKVVFGLLDFVCCNMILWGCTEVYEANFRHTKSIHDRWAELSGGLNRSLSADNRAEIISGIGAAQAFVIGDTEKEVIAKVRAVTEIPNAVVFDAYKRASATPRYGNPNSVWGMVNGLTEASQHATSHADKRTALDLKAARLMGLLKR